MIVTTQYDNMTEGRKHFKDLLDAAEDGRPASVRRDSHRAAVVDAERLRYALTRLHASGAQMVVEAGGWSIFIPGLPIAGDGADMDEALDEMVLALREYVEDWADHLRHAPNHVGNWGVVQIVSLSDEQQLKDWLVGR